MSANCGEIRDAENTSSPSCCGNGWGIPRLVALLGVSNSGGGRFTLRVRESLIPRANKKVALAVRFLPRRCSTPALAIALLEVVSAGSALKIDGRIDGLGAVELPPSSDWKTWVAARPYATCSK